MGSRCDAPAGAQPPEIRSWVVDSFERYARAVCERAGVTATDDDIAMLRLLDAGFSASIAALATATPDVFPHEPVDPSCAP